MMHHSESLAETQLKSKLNYINERKWIQWSSYIYFSNTVWSHFIVNLFSNINPFFLVANTQRREFSNSTTPTGVGSLQKASEFQNDIDRNTNLQGICFVSCYGCSCVYEKQYFYLEVLINKWWWYPYISNANAL